MTGTLDRGSRRDVPRSPSRMSTPLVLALASGMLCIGVVAIVVAMHRGDARPRATETGPAHVLVDQTTPERAAESWLDAWRTRAHEDALRLSVGAARDAVRKRMEDEQHMSPEDRAIGEAVWQQLADTRLHFVVSQSDHLPDGRLGLRGRAVGEWMGDPYERGLALVMEKRGPDWFVADYHFDDPTRHARTPADGSTVAPEPDPEGAP